jgi:hypothetical protein
MNAPDFIWLYEREAAQLSTDLGPSKSVDLLQYVRRDPAVLAALPEVQAMLAAKDEELARAQERGAPPTEYERKLAKLKEDFPYGI